MLWRGQRRPLCRWTLNGNLKEKKELAKWGPGGRTFQEQKSKDKACTRVEVGQLGEKEQQGMESERHGSIRKHVCIYEKICIYFKPPLGIQSFVNRLYLLVAMVNQMSWSLSPCGPWICCFSPEFQVQRSCNTSLECYTGLSDQTDGILISTELQDSWAAREEEGI